MDSSKSRGWRPVIGGALMLLAPWIVAGLCIYFSHYLARWPVRWWNDVSAPAILVAAVGSGLAGLWILPFGPWHKALVALAYIPVSVALLIVFGLYFVCTAFGDCL